MKKLLTLLLCFPLFSYGQKPDAHYHLDIHGCFMYAITAMVHSSDGFEPISGKRKKKAVYFKKEFYTNGFPEEIDGVAVRFIDIDINKETLLEEQKGGKAIVIYMSDLNLTADTCDLWMVPITLHKEGDNITYDYGDNGCHMFFNFSKEAGKMGYLKTICQQGKKEQL